MKQSSKRNRRTGDSGRTDEALVDRAKPASGSEAVRRIPVFVVVPPRLLLLDIAGPLEVLRQANRVQSAVRFEVHYIGPTSSLQTSIGITLAAIEPLPPELPPQSWVVIAGDVEYVMLAGGAPGPGKSADDEAAEIAIVTWLKAAVGSGHKLISICTGALIAARAGLLDGYSCTTHYLSCEELAGIAPRARILRWGIASR
jgi:transcriptional regulator GlxA family with amidase domain